MLEKMGAMRNAYGEALVELGASNPRVVVLGADTTDSMKSGMFGVKYPDRFFNLGIAEQNLVGVAAGLAFGGKICLRGHLRDLRPRKVRRPDTQHALLRRPRRQDSLLPRGASRSGPTGAHTSRLRTSP